MIKIGNVELPDFPLLLAPMEDVSDPPFRRLCKMHGADMMYSEFISSEGLIRDAIKSRKKLDIFDYERPIGIQIFGGDEEAMAMSAKIVETVEPDLVDINFGCPVKKVVSKGGGEIYRFACDSEDKAGLGYGKHQYRRGCGAATRGWHQSFNYSCPNTNPNV